MKIRYEPAFPNNIRQDKGMTLRDYFAAQVVSVVIADCLRHHVHEESIQDHYPSIASTAYGLADAMMAERQKALQ